MIRLNRNGIPIEKQERGYFYDPKKPHFKHEPRLTIPKTINGEWGQVPFFDRFPTRHSF